MQLESLQFCILVNPIVTNFALSVIAKPKLESSDPIDCVNLSREISIKFSFSLTVNPAVFDVKLGKLSCSSALFEDT